MRLTEVTIEVSETNEEKKSPGTNFLHVGGYSGISFVGDLETYNDTFVDMIIAYNEDFPQALGKTKSGIYRYVDKYQFFIQPRHRYNAWRDDLCFRLYSVMAESVWSNPEIYKDKPFFNLFDMSDCEGTFGTDVCKGLYYDFTSLRSSVANIDYSIPLAENDDFMSIYDEFTRAFEQGANGGVVQFFTRDW